MVALIDVDSFGYSRRILSLYIHDPVSGEAGDYTPLGIPKMPKIPRHGEHTLGHIEDAQGAKTW